MFADCLIEWELFALERGDAFLNLLLVDEVAARMLHSLRFWISAGPWKAYPA
jgi:hypothetical protein